MPLNSLVSLNVQASQTASLDLGTAAFNMAKTYSKSYANGVGAGMADRLFSDTRTVAASGTDDLDLAGVLADALGVTLSLVRVKGIVVSAADANVNDVLLGAAATNGFISWVGGAVHQVRIRPGSTFALFAGLGDTTGYTVTAATADLLRITNSGAGTAITYDVAIIGCSA